jgi:hypothetical protein
MLRFTFSQTIVRDEEPFQTDDKKSSNVHICASFLNVDSEALRLVDGSTNALLATALHFFMSRSDQNVHFAFHTPARRNILAKPLETLKAVRLTLRFVKI